ncbi:MAG: hypothetical protein QOJ02_2812 [Acidobacteriota bacterium]|jgi:hypothetical protein|nr:hypothetical protein [Acidobacteriota bacterium]
MPPENDSAAAKIPADDNFNSKSLEPGFKLRVILTLALFIVGITGIAFWWDSRPAKTIPRDYFKGDRIPYFNLTRAAIQ